MSGVNGKSSRSPSPTTTRPSGSIPATAAAYNGRGIAWHAKKDYDKAIADYDEAIRLDPEVLPRTCTQHALHTISYSSRTRTTRHMEEIRQGHRRLQRGDPARPEVRRRLLQPAASPGSDKKEYDKAIADYNEAIRLDPEGRRSPYYNRGYAWYDKKEYDKAIADYNEAIRLDPRDALALLQPRHRMERQEGLRQGHRRLQRGHPARSRVRTRLHQPRHRME